MNFFQLLKHIFLYLRFVGRRLVADRCLTVAGSLTYTSLLALVPILTVVLTLAAEVPATQQLVVLLRGFIFKNLVPEAAGKVVSIYLEQFAQNAAQLTFIGLAMIIVSAVTMLFTIDSVFNDIWRTRNQRAWFKRLAAYVMLLIFGPLLIGASLWTTSFVLDFTNDFTDLNRAVPLLDALVLRVVPFLLTTVALILAYRIIPNRHVPATHALAGGLFAALLFEMTKHLFVAYVVGMPTYSLVYGAFASVPIFLVWLFCCWIVVLIGAEVTATFSYFRHPDAQANDPLERLRAAVAMIDALAGDASANPQESAGTIELDFSTLRIVAKQPIDQAEDNLDCLVKAQYLVRVRSNGEAVFRLNKPRTEITDQLIQQALDA